MIPESLRAMGRQATKMDTGVIHYGYDISWVCELPEKCSWIDVHVGAHVPILLDARL